jgi:hypothetical protein
VSGAKMKNVLLYIWQLPQHIGALIFLRLLKKQHRVKDVITTDNGLVIIRIVDNGKNDRGRGVSLGKYIFLYKRHGETAQKHESGHSIQSVRLGPLYLPLVGIYSACLQPYEDIFMKDKSEKEKDAWYFSRPTESCADRLGGVKR